MLISLFSHLRFIVLFKLSMSSVLLFTFKVEPYVATVSPANNNFILS